METILADGYTIIARIKPNKVVFAKYQNNQWGYIIATVNKFNEVVDAFSLVNGKVIKPEPAVG